MVTYGEWVVHKYIHVHTVVANLYLTMDHWRQLLTWKAVNSWSNGAFIGQVAGYSPFVLCTCPPNEGRMEDKAIFGRVPTGLQGSVNREYGKTIRYCEVSNRTCITRYTTALQYYSLIRVVIYSTTKRSKVYQWDDYLWLVTCTSILVCASTVKPQIFEEANFHSYSWIEL